ncbi:hypothetical protein ASAC_0282 [Acidilobus saccharovorans 345-15]|uniref:Uncharacterized protein n=1 Tax=Acidilobus saccharovorans (strain DSM 16705 / JCM 18335 / VKM B-2471 / 345-15) TaxID=666510 RepID=D9Q051_ACIS3|nr:hypothetical protein [Acidilobus saccharovorans]ADL18689.1 hypothetical protein ASAC_0282 [Acidilobus saccharovorans 345-15]
MSLTPDEREPDKEDGKRRWVIKMIKSAKSQHKLCPYYDKKTQICFLMVTMNNQQGKCDREGRFDGCPMFTNFLERVYDDYTAKKKVLPNSFQDIVWGITSI